MKVNYFKQQWLLLWLVFIGCLGAGLAYPILPPLFLHPEHNGILPVTMNINYRSILLGVTLAAFPLGVFIGAPLLGALSDKFGKEKMIGLSLASASIGYLVSGIAISNHLLLLLILSRFFTGMFEGVIAIARSIADIPNINREQTFGRINAVSCLSFIFGPLIGGLLANNTLLSFFSFAFPFYFSSIVSLLTAIITVPYLLKYKTNKRRKSDHTPINIFTQFEQYARIPGLRKILLASTLFTLGMDIYFQFFPVVLTVKWHFYPWQIAIYLSCAFLFLSLGSTILVTILRMSINKERLTTLIMIAISVVTITLCSLFRSHWITLITIIILNLAMSGTITQITSKLSHTASSDIQGSIMGMQLGLRMLGDAILCLIGSSLIIFSLSFPFVLAAITMATSGIILFRSK